MFGHKVPPIEPDLGKHNPSLSLPGAQAHLFDEGVWQVRPLKDRARMVPRRVLSRNKHYSMLETLA